MSENERIIELLTRVDENQRKLLEVQQQHLQVAQAQLDRSNTTIRESLELQRTAVSRQALLTRFVIPVIVGLLALLAYFLVKGRVI